MLRRRLAVLRVADNLSDVMHTPGKLHPLSGDRVGQWAISLRGPYRLVIEAGGDPLPVDPDGRFDLTKVTAIRILEITDYND